MYGNFMQMRMVERLIETKEESSNHFYSTRAKKGIVRLSF
jgi:hypothetical protein